MKDFNGKLAVVTGGASGVGFAIGEALAKQGAKVVLTDIEKESLENSTALLTNQSLDVYSKVADVSNIESMQELASWCKAEHGSVHLLFNNAGVAPAELLPIWDTKPNDWQWAYGVNVMGVLMAFKHLFQGCLLMEKNQELSIHVQAMARSLICLQLLSIHHQKLLFPA